MTYSIALLQLLPLYFEKIKTFLGKAQLSKKYIHMLHYNSLKFINQHTIRNLDFYFINQKSNLTFTFFPYFKR